MIITAKYASTCPTCRRAIDIGSKVEWSKGSPAKHAGCAAVPVRAPSPTLTAADYAVLCRTPARSTRPARRQPMGSGHGYAGQMPGYSSYCTDNDSCRCYDCAS